MLKTIEFIEQHVPKKDAILDIGAYASEVLCSLHHMNYTSLHGIDLNPKISGMPYADSIQYTVSDFLQTPFPDETFSAITAISVIEHGLNTSRLLKEMWRILKPGGVFLASVDYWPEKIPTGDIKVFGMDWTIFSREDIVRFMKEAEQAHFVPCGELHLSAGDRIAHWNGRAYTFAWLAIRKKTA